MSTFVWDTLQAQKLLNINMQYFKYAISSLVLVNKGLEGLKSDSRRGSMGGSRRGSLIPGRSRQGSIALGGADRATVAMVTDDPQNKKNLKAALAGAFDDNAISKWHIFSPCFLISI